MKKYFKVILFSFILISMFLIVTAPLYAALGEGFDSGNILSGSDGGAVFSQQFNKIWSTTVTVVRVAAFTGILILGVTYILSNADKKADIKKSLIPVIIGLIIVFGSTYIIDFIKALFNDI